ncbi:pyruvate, phosphate dikinase [Streptococcus halichoeri]|uniref:pyruvate, phosphate dikinase n=1 Tax=Streptococcus halichoeri TaxID=254785 RepID=UPI001358B92F|nr:pyruvate, phosphate dikinase [Streptococcus halichoeri]
MERKFVYHFAEGHKDMRTLLGGKGANLAEMTRIGLPVPQGFTITTQACNDYYEHHEVIRELILEQIEEALGELEKAKGQQLGSADNPLLVSVRSGAVFSMPGMMDTILNLGLNDSSVKGLAQATHNERFAYDSYRRFIQMFSDVARGLPKTLFDQALAELKAKHGYQEDTELSSQDLKKLVQTYQAIYLQQQGHPFPQDPKEQLLIAIEAVFDSWNNPRAKVYRKLNDISQSLGTAVTIQAMVFGNMGETSGTGVAFTRNPSTGKNQLFGEYLINAQGEDVVAGIRTPQTIASLADKMPDLYQQFVSVAKKLENHYRDMQDLEFTIEKGRLYMLQTRSGKRTAQAAVKIAVDQVQEGLISQEEAILRIEPQQLDHLLHPSFAPADLAQANHLATGLPASPGAACGRVYFHAQDAVQQAKAGQAVLLVRQETSAEDIEGMISAQGIITARGGMTSHAAVVARGMGKPCVAGCSQLVIDEAKRCLHLGQTTLQEGDFLSLDGSTGAIYLGQVPMSQTALNDDYQQFMAWVDAKRELQVRSNADKPADVNMALAFGAQGIGLCRTEHMFFEESRIALVREMILANTKQDRIRALDKLLPLQRADFQAMFTALNGKSCTIRLLDPPLHEFLPQDEAALAAMATQLDLPLAAIYHRLQELAEFNPMLGHRGCRLAITYPEIYEMQARAIVQGALLAKQAGIKVQPEIMVPLVSSAKELARIRTLLEQTITQELQAKQAELTYQIGTMIELPRACVTADEIAQVADFFSFGTNDLTQMGFGFSRDDAGKFLGDYLEEGILDNDPFQVLDQKGIGRLLAMAVDLGRSVKPHLQLGICGEHGGEPASVAFCYQQGLDYVSCSPFRVPLARLAAAQASIKKAGPAILRDK